MLFSVPPFFQDTVAACRNSEVEVEPVAPHYREHPHVNTSPEKSPCSRRQSVGGTVAAAHFSQALKSMEKPIPYVSVEQLSPEALSKLTKLGTTIHQENIEGLLSCSKNRKCRKSKMASVCEQNASIQTTSVVKQRKASPSWQKSWLHQKQGKVAVKSGDTGKAKRSVPGILRAAAAKRAKNMETPKSPASIGRKASIPVIPGRKSFSSSSACNTQNVITTSPVVSLCMDLKTEISSASACSPDDISRCSRLDKFQRTSSTESVRHGICRIEESPRNRRYGDGNWVNATKIRLAEHKCEKRLRKKNRTSLRTCKYSLRWAGKQTTKSETSLSKPIMPRRLSQVASDDHGDMPCISKGKKRAILKQASDRSFTGAACSPTPGTFVTRRGTVYGNPTVANLVPVLKASPEEAPVHCNSSSQCLSIAEKAAGKLKTARVTITDILKLGPESSRHGVTDVSLKSNQRTGRYPMQPKTSQGRLTHLSSTKRILRRGRKAVKRLQNSWRDTTQPVVRLTHLNMLKLYNPVTLEGFKTRRGTVYGKPSLTHLTYTPRVCEKLIIPKVESPVENSTTTSSTSVYAKVTLTDVMKTWDQWDSKNVSQLQKSCLHQKPNPPQHFVQSEKGGHETGPWSRSCPRKAATLMQSAANRILRQKKASAQLQGRDCRLAQKPVVQLKHIKEYPEVTESFTTRRGTVYGKPNLAKATVCLANKPVVTKQHSESHIVSIAETKSNALAKVRVTLTDIMKDENVCKDGTLLSQPHGVHTEDMKQPLAKCHRKTVKASKWQAPPLGSSNRILLRGRKAAKHLQAKASQASAKSLIPSECQKTFQEVFLESVGTQCGAALAGSKSRRNVANSYDRPGTYHPEETSSETCDHLKEAAMSSSKSVIVDLGDIEKHSNTKKEIAQSPVSMFNKVLAAVTTAAENQAVETHQNSCHSPSSPAVFHIEKLDAGTSTDDLNCDNSAGLVDSPAPCDSTISVPYSRASFFKSQTVFASETESEDNDTTHITNASTVTAETATENSSCDKETSVAGDTTPTSAHPSAAVNFTERSLLRVPSPARSPAGKKIKRRLIELKCSPTKEEGTQKEHHMRMIGLQPKAMAAWAARKRRSHRMRKLTQRAAQWGLSR